MIVFVIVTIFFIKQFVLYINVLNMHLNYKYNTIACNFISIKWVDTIAKCFGV